MSGLVRGLVGLAAPLLAGCYVTYLPVKGGWSWSPLALVALLAGGVAVGQAARAVHRRPLEEAPEALPDGVAALAELAGVRLRGITVADERLEVGGEVVFTPDELAEGDLSRLLSRAARQLAAMTAPALFGGWGLALTGAALGVILAGRERLGGGAGASLLAIAASLGLAWWIGWRMSRNAEQRGPAIEQRARELLGELRQNRPDLFAELAARQGLAP
ncbi:MAG: hypothetical protein HYU66_26230 [Armatimonadetes bacterium]|nr:hypothetical protein [Armatimonadota bacterium]